METISLSGSPVAASIDLSRGTNQSGGRVYNERLVLSMIRRQGALPKAEIARRTGLSAQTISVIMRQLEADGLVLRGDPQRGRVGQPAVPYSLDPDGALSIGLKIGRRSSDLVLLDLAGRTRVSLHEPHPYPSTAELAGFVKRGVDQLRDGLPPPLATRICGIGIATPFELWNWGPEVGAPAEVMEEWRNFDIRAAVARETGLETFLRNDGTSACAAELMFGNPAGHDHFIYFFIGSFIGGGVVLNGNVVNGPSGNAGALGPMPIHHLGEDGRLSTSQLIRFASNYTLERQLRERGVDPSAIWRSPADWGELGTVLDDWIETVAASLAHAIACAISVIDFPAAIIDGAVPVAVRRRIVAATSEHLGRIDRQGLSGAQVIEGAIGSNARALGGATLPLLANFAPDRDIPFLAHESVRN